MMQNREKDLRSLTNPVKAKNERNESSEGTIKK